MHNTLSPATGDHAIEQLIKAKGADRAPRITMDDVIANIVSAQYHVFEGSSLTVCVLTLKNGFTVTGESACASPENFNAEIGQRIARDNAVQKVWPLMGYSLRSQIAGVAA